jgi:hypothetical protein
MQAPRDVAAIRLDNALALFEEFVRATAKHADAATLRGLERRFAERLLIQPSYWSQLKGRSRQIGERLARQFEQCCHKPAGWMDLPHDGSVPIGEGVQPPSEVLSTPKAHEGADSPLPQDDDERFIVGLVLTYYRRHPQRARTRLLDLLGEVLMPSNAEEAVVLADRGASGHPTDRTPASPRLPPRLSAPKPAAGVPATPASGTARHPTPDPRALWAKTQAGVVPLKKKR